MFWAAEFKYRIYLNIGASDKSKMSLKKRVSKNITKKIDIHIEIK